MIKFGVVGFGLHAVKRLMPGFTHAKHCRVTALSRRSMQKAQASAKQFDIPLAFDSVDALCQSSEVDAVLVTTPNAMHLQDVLTAVRHGKHVLCEKPMGVSADECRQMVEAAGKDGVLLGVAQVFRFEDSTRRLRERLAAGQIGKPIFARAEFSFPAKTGHARQWLYDPAVAGGGPIADVGVHCIDGLRYILQDEVTSVSARDSRDEVSGALEAAAAIILEFAKGTLATVQVSFRADYRTPLEIVGEHGSLRAENGFNVEHPINIELRDVWDAKETETVSNAPAYSRQVDAFAQAIEGGAPFPVSGEEGWQNQEIIDAAYRSIRSGKSEPVPRRV
jgi:predicted dehydrogenase